MKTIDQIPKNAAAHANRQARIIEFLQDGNPQMKHIKCAGGTIVCDLNGRSFREIMGYTAYVKLVKRMHAQIPCIGVPVVYVVGELSWLRAEGKDGA